MNQEEASQQQTLLYIHRQNLAIYIRQRAQHGNANVPPIIENSIREARENIKQIKQALQRSGYRVHDEANDFEPPQPVQPAPQPFVIRPRTRLRVATEQTLAEWEYFLVVNMVSKHMINGDIYGGSQESLVLNNVTINRSALRYCGQEPIVILDLEA